MAPLKKARETVKDTWLTIYMRDEVVEIRL